MGTEVAPRAPSPVAGVAAARGRARTLTHRASLNAVAALLDYGAKIITSLVVTPILVSGLGRSAFGIWEMLSRLGNYMSATDGRPSEALRLVVAQHQGHDDEGIKRRHVGAALAVWILILPIVLATGAGLVWIAPGLTKAPAALRGDVRLTTGLLVASFLLGSLGAVPESVLRGMNLAYRRMGFQAGLNILGGVLAAGAVWMGLGLAGVGGAGALRGLFTGLCFLFLVRRYVGWFGAAKPSWTEVKSLFGVSVWLALGDAVAKVLLASDVIILGAVLAPTVVTTYVLTGHAARLGSGIHVFGAGAAIPGLGGLLGERQMERAAAVRRELLLLTWLYVTVVGTTILLWNHAFVTLWVGAENYAGGWINLLIVMLGVQTAFIRMDAYIIDAALRPKARVLVSVAAAVVAIALGVGLTHAFGLVGLCIGMLVGRGVQSVAYPLLVRATVGTSGRGGSSSLAPLRLFLATGMSFATAILVGQRVVAAGWFTWVLGVVVTAVVMTVVAAIAAPNAEGRRIVWRRARILLPDRWRL